MAISTAEYMAIGPRRKELVNCISEAIGCPAKYLGAPTFAYQVDYITISREGIISFGDQADADQIEHVTNHLNAHGFATGTPESAEKQTTPDPQKNATQGEIPAFSMQIPRDKVNTENLVKILQSKESLIKKALGIHLIPIIIKDEIVEFPWFKDISDDEVKAYTHFIAAVCKLSVDAKRVSMTAKPVTNEKYAFRCFLLRLGFIGNEYKEERKILLQNLSGSPAFKNGGANNANT